MSNTDLTWVSCSKLHPGCDAVVHFLLRCKEIMFVIFLHSVVHPSFSLLKYLSCS